MGADGSMEEAHIPKKVNYSGGTPSTPAVLDQKELRNRMFGMMAQDLLVKNSDATYNIHSMPKVNKEFNFAMPKVERKTTTFKKSNLHLFILNAMCILG